MGSAFPPLHLFLPLSCHRVPEDLSACGFDNIDYAKYSDPPITTISQPTEEIGKMATDLLLRLIDGEYLGRTDFIRPYDFIIRKSTGLKSQK